MPKFARCVESDQSISAQTTRSNVHPGGKLLYFFVCFDKGIAGINLVINAFGMVGRSLPEMAKRKIVELRSMGVGPRSFYDLC